jgi:hypothetical protein
MVLIRSHHGQSIMPTHTPLTARFMDNPVVQQCALQHVMKPKVPEILAEMTGKMDDG